jgi:hypothetical protein
MRAALSSAASAPAVLQRAVSKGDAEVVALETAVVAGFSAYLPARLAMSVDPATVLKSE